jgi:secreted trypsin-like serine protease
MSAEVMRVSFIGFAILVTFLPVDGQEPTVSAEVKQCDCMKYWQCVNSGGTPYSYCGINDICCLFGDPSDSRVSASLTNKPLKTGVCGLKGQDSRGDGVSEPGEWAWHVAILEKPQDLYVCGASLLDEHWVMTAAHCVDDYKDALRLKVRIGEFDVSSLNEPVRHEEYDVATLFVHPQFNNNTLLNDIALMKLVKPVKKKTNVNIVCLPEANLFSPEELLSAKCIVTGWGRRSENAQHSLVLKEVVVPLWRHPQCESALKGHFGPNYRLPETTICAGAEGSDACDGDGGGPLVCEKNQTWYQMGIVSFGIGCGRRNTPGVYTKVEAFTPWVFQVAGDSGSN